MLLKPKSEETPAYFHYYINLIPQANLHEALQHNLLDTVALYSAISEDKANYTYASGKWTIKQVLQHCVDVERVLMYRALRACRQDATATAGFNEDDYAMNDNCQNLKLSEIVDEYKSVRASTIQFYKNNEPTKLQFILPANKWQTNALQLGWFTSGHCKHHNKVVKEKYLNK